MLMQAIRAKEDELSLDKYREEYEHLEHQAMRLKKECKMVQDDLATAQMDPNEARNLLLARVRYRPSRVPSFYKNGRSKTTRSRWSKSKSRLWPLTKRMVGTYCLLRGVIS